MIEEQEFIKLYKQWYNPIHRYIQSRGLSPEISEELTQDVFMAVWKYLDTLNTQYNVKNWLYTIAHNKVIDYHRGKAWKNDTCLPISEDGHFAIGPDEMYDVIEPVHIALASMSERERNILVQTSLFGYSQRGLARTYKVTTRTIRNNLASARSAFKSAYREEVAS